MKVEQIERQIASLTGLVHKVISSSATSPRPDPTPPTSLSVPNPSPRLNPNPPGSGAQNSTPSPRPPSSPNPPTPSPRLLGSNSNQHDINSIKTADFLQVPLKTSGKILHDPVLECSVLNSVSEDVNDNFSSSAKYVRSSFNANYANEDDNNLGNVVSGSANKCFNKSNIATNNDSSIDYSIYDSNTANECSSRRIDNKNVNDSDINLNYSDKCFPNRLATSKSSNANSRVDRSRNAMENFIRNEKTRNTTPSCTSQRKIVKKDSSSLRSPTNL